MVFHFLSAAPRRTLIVTALSAALLIPATASFADSSSGPTGTIVGTVTCGADAITAAPNARIAVDGLSVSTTSDSAGKFTLSNVPAGQLLNIDALADPAGSVSATRYNVTISANSVTDIGNLDLAACPQAPAPVVLPEPNQWSPDLQGNGY
jgi:hypothetical protein